MITARPSQASRAGARGDDAPGNLVAESQRQGMIGAHAVVEIAEIGMADAATGDRHDDLAVGRRRVERLADHRPIRRRHHPPMSLDALRHAPFPVLPPPARPPACGSVVSNGILVSEYQMSKPFFPACRRALGDGPRPEGATNAEAIVMTRSIPSTSLSIVLTGSGGAGVMTAGQTLLDAATSCGFYGLMTRSTGPQIRGGEAAAMIRLSSKPVQSPGDRFDILLALDFENVQRFAAELPLDSRQPDRRRSGGRRNAGLSQGFGRDRRPRADGQARQGRPRRARFDDRPRACWLGSSACPRSAIVAAVAASIGRKKPEALAASEKAVLIGAEAAPDVSVAKLAQPSAPSQRRWSITGNEATGFGALKGGVKFVGGYPITPATEILEWMAHALPQCGGVLMQAEDELASINMIIGASYGGAPSLTATAGPGLSLMIESLGLAVAAEIPLVVVDVMRSGPSTGIATKSEQSDLNIAVYGLHGDAPHVVTAPLSVADCLADGAMVGASGRVAADASHHAVRPIARPGQSRHRQAGRRRLSRPSASSSKARSRATSVTS